MGEGWEAGALLLAPEKAAVALFGFSLCLEAALLAPPAEDMAPAPAEGLAIALPLTAWARAMGRVRARTASMVFFGLLKSCQWQWYLYLTPSLPITTTPGETETASRDRCAPWYRAMLPSAAGHIAMRPGRG